MSPVPVVLERNTRPAVADKYISGFHVIEERLRSFRSTETTGEWELLYANPGPRVKKILAQAKEVGVPSTQVEKKVLDSLVLSLPETAQDHRGLLLRLAGESTEPQNLVDFSQWIKTPREQALVLVLDSITDPHNVGAILRSCDQFGVDLVVMPERRSLKEPLENEVVFFEG